LDTQVVSNSQCEGFSSYSVIAEHHTIFSGLSDTVVPRSYVIEAKL
jgi:hypothetical protein